MAHLVFAIDAGEIVWLASHDTKEDAVEHINNLRPDGTLTGSEAGNDASIRYEFAFTVESAHFVSFV